uniref:Pentatricopeptide repeat-containing protein n=1 Tax=Populus alba TaxID=43335 RepID=A0A4U5Q4X0_POPAL|nr:pentatricopeptide repeat-containing protein [Populus alba]
MKSKHNIDPDIRHYGCMVDLLGKAGRLEEAEELIRSMPMKADVVIWGMLLSACKTHRNITIGERAAENLAKLDPSNGQVESFYQLICRCGEVGGRFFGEESYAKP